MLYLLPPKILEIKGGNHKIFLGKHPSRIDGIRIIDYKKEKNLGKIPDR